MKRNQQGFSALEALLILFIIAIIGGVGFFVYKSQKEAKNSQDNANKSSQEIASSPKEQKPEEKKPADETASWLLYEPPGKEYTVRLPDGWKLERYQKNASLYALDTSSITYKAGTSAVVTEVQSGKDASTVAFALNFSTTAPTIRGSLGKQFKTAQGLDVKQYIFEQTGEPEGIDIPTGTKEYQYHVTKDGKHVVFIHDAKSNETAQTARLEQIITSLTIK